MKKYVLALLCGAALLLSFSGCAQKDQEDALVIFNYGEYMDPQVIELFEEETGIEVKYEEYVTPEDMYTKFEGGGTQYDLICTSDYMVEKMIAAGQAKPIDWDSMENAHLIDKTYMNFCSQFDPGNTYACPYLFGTVGILYNTNMVKQDIDSWEVLWDSTYQNSIIAENSVRDAFLPALKLLGYSINTTKKDQLQGAFSLLKGQKPILMAYLVDETRDVMIGEEAALAVTYSGDATEAIDANPNLAYVVPKEGSNIWFDCFMIPSSCQHEEYANRFIDFLCREDIAMMNFEYIYYGSPNRAVYQALDEETRQDETIFPSREVLDKCEVYQYLGQDTEQYYNRLWKELKAYR